ncbi:MAG: MerR family transcriptional regulator [uncultured Thiotrichaceae bacterium]|uniref:MerR family transcriptional regulator n=1 Tax=uncultured Thiotrichaceae bacterium TaxID=298394 RepID=A0A6S6RX35_9GAMM|nr:MAG: MerR family transcriptional regulator [uncultured Thiotrichaceae bacterium]
MSSRTGPVLSGYIFEEEAMLSLSELCQSCQMPAEMLVKLVEYGIITPEGNAVRDQQAHQWLFQRSEMIRADKAFRMERDLGINFAGIALVMDLLVEVDDLRQQVYQMRIADQSAN